MNCSQLMEGNLFIAKKRKLSETIHSVNGVVDNHEDGSYGDIRNCQCNEITAVRRFIHIQHKDCDTIFHTEDWNPSGSIMFSPITEDLMINTRNIEQFSCSQGNFFVAGQDGMYSKTISGEVLHLWRFCSQKRRLFISRSFLFKNSQDFYQVQQLLQGL